MGDGVGAGVGTGVGTGGDDLGALTIGRVVAVCAGAAGVAGATNAARTGVLARTATFVVLLRARRGATVLGTPSAGAAGTVAKPGTAATFAPRAATRLGLAAIALLGAFAGAERLPSHHAPANNNAQSAPVKRIARGAIRI